MFTKNGLVKGEKFDSWRNIGSVLPAINLYTRRDVDGLVLLNLDVTKQESEINYHILKEFCENSLVPFYYGGGIKRVDQVKDLLKIGVDKVILNTTLYNNLKLLKDINKYFGKQFVVVSIDYKKIYDDYFCFSNCGQVNQNIKVLDWIRKIEAIGFSELILTSINHDGMMKGYDIQFLEANEKKIKSNLIISGGAGNPNDMLSAFNFINVDAVAASSMFHFKEITPKDCKNYLRRNNIKVR